MDDVRIYNFIEEIKNLNFNNNIKGFETASEIIKYLKDQFAGLFQRFLEEQTRIKEISLIKNLEKTSQTLNNLVNFLKDENKDKDDEINKILMINHPLVEEIRTRLDVPYNFYIEGFQDLSNILSARGYKYIVNLPNDNYYKFEKIISRKRFHLFIAKSLFDSDNKLKYIRKTDWQEPYVFTEEFDE